MTTRRRLPRPEQLTPEELEAWRRFVATARPLRGPAPAPAPPPDAPQAATEPAPPARPSAAVAPSPPHPPRPPAPLSIGHHPPGVDNTRWTGLTRGKLRAERRLDLHGMTLARAHAATRAFIEAAARDHCRVVEIVTGLGERGEGAIRREFMHWINAPELRARVLAVAHPHRGNAGAVRLLLRRRRPG